ncbi:MAG TPA: cytochrome c maturation protein CcmE [Acidobacteriaceae bacterium]|jgi:cytochrome c-type biogenesis protein CcmE|nr:cytochrome c maturation protein CcmE [Acidobacteriaceae bacterium]
MRRYARTAYNKGIMKSGNQQTVRIVLAVLVILGAISYLAVTGVEANKSYYVTIQELQAMGSKAYTRNLRVAGSVEPGTIQRDGAHASFVLVENNLKVHVAYTGDEPPPDTFKDNSQALAIGTYGRDGVFHATQLQAKCASKYAPAQQKTAVATQNTAMATQAGQ